MNHFNFWPLMSRKDKLVYQGAINSESHTFVDFENLVEETKKWIEQMSE